MSAEGLLENPALFSGNIHDLDKLAIEYLELWEKHDKYNIKPVRPHLFKMLHEGLRNRVDLRKELGQSMGFEAFKNVAHKLAESRKDVKPEDKFGWYDRYRHYNLKQHTALKGYVAPPKAEEEKESEDAALGKRN